MRDSIDQANVDQRSSEAGCSYTSDEYTIEKNNSEIDKQEQVSYDLYQTYSWQLPDKLAYRAGQHTVDNKSVSNKVMSSFYYEEKRTMYLGLESGHVVKYDLTKSERLFVEVARTSGYTTAICCPSYSSALDSTLVATGAVDSNIKLWETQKERREQDPICIQTLTGHSGAIQALTSHGCCIVSASTDKTIRVWTEKDGRKLFKYPWYEPMSILIVSTNWTTSLSMERYMVGGEGGVLGALFGADLDGCIYKTEYCASIAIQSRNTNHLTMKHCGPSKVDGNKQQIFCRTGNCFGVRLVKFQASLNALAVLSNDNSIRLFNSESSTLIWAVDNENCCTYNDVIFLPAQKELVACDTLGYVSIHSLENGNLIASKRVNQKPLQSIYLSQQSDHSKDCLQQRLYLVQEKSIQYWTLNRAVNYKLIREGHTDSLVGLYACSGAKMTKSTKPSTLKKQIPNYALYSAALDNTIKQWDPFKLICTNSVKEYQFEISCMAVVEENDTVVTGHDNGLIRLWKFSTGTSINVKEHINTVSALHVTQNFKAEGTPLLFSACYDGTVCIFNLRSLVTKRVGLLQKFKINSSTHFSAATISKADTSDVRISQQEKISTYCTDNNSELMQSLDTKSSQMTARYGSPTTERSQASTKDSIIDTNSTQVDCQSTQIPQNILENAHRTEILCITHDPLKNVLVTGGNDTIIRIWHAATGELLAQHSGHDASITALDFDGHFLLSGSEDTSVRVWETLPKGGQLTSSTSRTDTRQSQSKTSTSQKSQKQSGLYGGISQNSKEIAKLQGHKKTVSGLVVNDVTGYVASVGKDGLVIWWDYVQQVQIRRIDMSVTLTCVCLRQDVDELVVGSSDGNLYRLDAMQATSHNRIQLYQNVQPDKQ